MPLLEHVQTRETKIGQEEVGDLRTGKGRMVLKSRFTLNWPLDPPFLDPELYANPVILDFLEKYWGTEIFTSPACIRIILHRVAPHRIGIGIRSC